MSTLQIIFGSIAAITAIAGIAFPLWLTKNRHALRWAIIETKSLLEVADEIASDISIKYYGQEISDITRYRFVLHNLGRTPIDKSDIVVPFKWEGPGKVLSAKIIASNPPVDLKLKIENNEVEISWSLFNQKCIALIEILCEGGSTDEKGKISGQIRNIPAIEIKTVTVISENEYINRLKSTMQLTTPKYLYPITKIFLNKWFIRWNRWFLTLYIAALPLIILGVIVEDTGAPSWVLSVGIVLSAAIIFGIIMFKKNPYARLVASTKSSANRKQPAANNTINSDS